MIRPFQDEFALLSRLSGIPRQNLINRAAILMKTLVPEEKWNKQAQEDMKTWLNAANLRLKYHRLRPKHALCAFNHVVAELADGDQLPGAAQEFMKHRLRRHDWVMSVAEPAQRLENIVFSPEFGKINRREGNWVDIMDLRRLR
ncbi:MAG: hypothetical protein R3B95_07925 [Nitrospirales bacterium]|nr:hypothetical protein [Nitrospirales bacterium]